VAGLNRRQLIARGGALVGAGLAAAYLPSFAGAQGRSGLAEERRRNFAALVDSLDRSPQGLPIDVSQIDASRAEQAAQALARRYEREPDLVRRNVDTILDALDRPGQRRGTFATLDRGVRRDEVARAFSETRGQGRSMSRAFLVGQAVELAISLFADENEELERLSDSGDKDIGENGSDDNEPNDPRPDEKTGEPTPGPAEPLDSPLTGEGNAGTP